MFKVVVRLFDGEVVDAYRDRYEDAVTFKVKTLQWGIQFGKKYYSPAQVEKVLVEEASTPTGDQPKRKASTRKRTGGRTKQSNPSDV